MEGSKNMVTRQQIHVAIRFLFPDLSQDDMAYKKLAVFICKRYEKIGTCVLYAKNDRLMKLLRNYSLAIGKKEVIIVGRIVRATENYSVACQKIF